MIKIKSYGSGSSGNCYIATNGNTNIILECGVAGDTIYSMLNDFKLSFSDIQACFASHSHKDHSDNIKLLQDYGIKCYCTPETATRFLLDLDMVELLKDKKMYSINNGDIKIKALKVNHGKCECYGFILGDKDGLILFLTDFMKIDTNLKNFKFKEIWIECNYIDSIMNDKLADKKLSNYMNDKLVRQFNTHQSLSNLIYHLENKINLIDCDKINLIHISKEVGNPQIMQETIEDRFGIPTYAILGNGDIYSA